MSPSAPKSPKEPDTGPRSRTKRFVFLFGVVGVFALTAVVTILAVTIWQPNYKYVSSYYDGTAMHACTRPLKASLQRLKSADGHVYSGYVPLSSREIHLYCYLEH